MPHETSNFVIGFFIETLSEFFEYLPGFVVDIIIVDIIIIVVVRIAVAIFLSVLARFRCARGMSIRASATFARIISSQWTVGYRDEGRLRGGREAPYCAARTRGPMSAYAMPAIVFC